MPVARKSDSLRQASSFSRRGFFASEFCFTKPSQKWRRKSDLRQMKSGSGGAGRITIGAA